MSVVDVLVVITGLTGAMMPTLGGSAGSGWLAGSVLSVAFVADEFQAIWLMSLPGTRTENAVVKDAPAA